MPKSKSKTKNGTRRVLCSKPAIIAITVSVLVSSVISAAIGVAVYKQIAQEQDTTYISKIGYMIERANRGVTTETPTASYSDKLFIHEAKVEFDRAENTRLRHIYLEEQDDQHETIFLTDDSLLDAASSRMLNALTITDSLELVPLLQECTRVYAVTFAADKQPQFYGSYSQVDSKTLNDGRTIYIWKTDEPACTQEDQFPFDEYLLATIESIQSY